MLKEDLNMKDLNIEDLTVYWEMSIFAGCSPHTTAYKASKKYSPPSGYFCVCCITTSD